MMMPGHYVWFDTATAALVFGFLPLILGGLSLLSGLFGGKNKQKSTQTTTPTLDPAYQPLQNIILPSIMQRLNNPSKLPAEFQTRGIKGINRTYDMAEQGLQNRLTSRGLASSSVANAGVSKLSGDRAGSIVNFNESLPLIERDMQNQDLMMALQTLGYGRGSTTTGTSEGGSRVGSGLSSLATMLGFLSGQGLFGMGGQNTPYGNLQGGSSGTIRNV